MTECSSSGFDSPEFKAAAEDLWALLGSPFEGDLDPLKYKAHLTLPVSAESPVHRQEYNDYVKILAQKEICRTYPWEVDIAYSPPMEGLGVSKLFIPLNAPGRHNLVFQSTPNGYIPLYGENGTLREIPSPADYRKTRYDATSDYVDKLILSAGYDFRRLGSHPNKLRLRMAEFIEASTEANVEENATVISDASLQTVITRSLCKQIESDGMFKSTSVIDRTSAGVNRRAAENLPRQTITIDLRATSEFIRPHSPVREQLVVEFCGNDFDIEKPIIYKQRLRQIGNKILGQDDVCQYVVEDREEIEPTIDVIHRLAESFTDSMSEG